MSRPSDAPGIMCVGEPTALLQLEVPKGTCLAPGHEGIPLLGARDTKPGTCAAQGWKPFMYQTCRTPQYHLTLVFRFLGANLPPVIPSTATSFPSVPREVLSYHFGLNAHTLLQPGPANQGSAGNTWDIAAVPNTS